MWLTLKHYVVTMLSLLGVYYGLGWSFKGLPCPEHSSSGTQKRCMVPLGASTLKSLLWIGFCEG